MLTTPPVNTAEQLLRDVHDFVSETGMSESALLTGVGCDRRVFKRLRAGRAITTTVHDRIRNFMTAERARRAAAGGERHSPRDQPQPQEQQP